MQGVRLRGEEERAEAERRLLERLGHRFRDPSLLEAALTHPSVQGAVSYQRLEFLGDAVVEIFSAELLYALYPEDDEGALAKKKSSLVARESLAEAARMFGVGEALRLSPGEEGIGGRDNPKNLEDAAEALAGALYADGGLGAAKLFLVPALADKAAALKDIPEDAKTALQEYSQGRKKGLPVYDTQKISGASHAPVFRAEVSLISGEKAAAEGASKKLAERLAAAQLLRLLEERLQK